MYTLVSAKVKPVDRNGFWLDEDVSTKTIDELFTDYKKVILLLTNNFLTGDLYLNLADIAWLPFLNRTMTLSEWFTDIGNLALPTSTDVPDFTPSLIHYRDAWQCNYDIKQIPSDYNPDVEIVTSSKNDLLLTRSDIDYMEMGRKCLVSVNGLIHRTEGSEYGLYVREGGRSSRLANKTQVGIISFNQVSDITILPFTPEMVVQPNLNTTMKEAVYLNLGVSLQNKTPVLVLGGYLHFLGDSYYIVNDTSIKIVWSRIPYAKRYFESRRLMDLSSLGLSQSVVNPSQVAVAELMSDDVIMKYLQLSQSFIVLIDSVDLFLERQMLEGSDLPGIYYHDSEPTYPMQLALGRIGNYWKRYDDGKWVISIEENVYKHYMYETTHWLSEVSIDDTKDVNRPVEYADAYLMMMGIS